MIGIEIFVPSTVVEVRLADAAEQRRQDPNLLQVADVRPQCVPVGRAVSDVLVGFPRQFGPRDLAIVIDGHRIVRRRFVRR
jgi:hypothetical protein